MTIYFERNFQRGFGTYPLMGDELMSAVTAAVEVGYRAFDTAQMYGNEADTGVALTATGLPRDEFCITTKVHPDNFGEDRFLASVERSLAALRVDQVDVLLLHWPPIGGNVAPSLRLLQQALDRGLTRNIGVSNYTVAMMNEAVAVVDAPIVTNQVEFHPLLDQSRLLSGACGAGVPLSSYCSVARGRVLESPELVEIGASYGKSAVQVALRWIVQKGVSVNVMSSNPANIRANFDIADFCLNCVDMERIERISKRNYRIVQANISPWAPDWD